MEEKHLLELMESHGIKPTANRIVIARALAAAGRPMSMTELETVVETIDKSNVFRTLQAFREAHLVHVLDDSGDGVRYELCHSHHDDEDDDVHVHFYCEKCHRTFAQDRQLSLERNLPGLHRSLITSEARVKPKVAVTVMREPLWETLSNFSSSGSAVSVPRLGRSSSS